MTDPRLRRFSHVIAFDDAPFARSHRGDVALVGVVFAGSRLDAVLRGRVRRDGANAARTMAAMIAGSRFVEHLQLIMLQGIAVAGFNVVDVFALHEATRLPILVVSRKRPDFIAIRDALHGRVRGGARKWRIIEKLGAIEKVGGVYVQRVGLTAGDAVLVIGRFAINGFYPEPLRVAHLVASASITST
jgi:endonuclease V-like protein UPF0215 family